MGEFVTRYVPRTTWAFVEGICGYNLENSHIDMTRMSLMARLDTGGTSAKNMLHWTQMSLADKVRQFDYGSSTINL